MGYSSTPSGLFEQLLEISSRSADAGEFEAAYHILMAALHVADHSDSPACLDQVLRLAVHQSATLEQLHPIHPLSRAHAKKRGTTAVYDSLLRHLDSVRLRLDSRLP